MTKVNFSKAQIEAIKQEFNSCFEIAHVDGQFNAYAFHGAVETFIQMFIDDGHLFYDETKIKEA